MEARLIIIIIIIIIIPVASYTLEIMDDGIGRGTTLGQTKIRLPFGSQ
jgi:hypothetical protein